MAARIQRRRSAGWRRGSAVIVDRTSRYGNPFRIFGNQSVLAPDAPPYDGRAWTCSTPEAARKWAVTLYADWLDGTGPDVYFLGRRTYDRRAVLTALELGKLTGRDLACTCPEPRPGQTDHCHGAYLLHRANPARRS